MHNDFILIRLGINNVKTLSLRSTQSLQWANTYKDSAYVHAYEIQNTWGNKIKVIVTLFMTRYVQR